MEVFFHVLSLIAKEDSEMAEEAAHLLDALRDNADSVLFSVKARMQRSLEENDFATASALADYCSAIKSFLESIPDLEIQKPITSVKPAATSIRTKKPKADPVRESLRVDSSEPHALSEKYQNKKITGYSFQGEYVEVSSWQDAQMKLLLELLRRHPNQFDTVLTDSRLRGKTRAYFTKKAAFTNGGQQENSLIPGTEIYVHSKASSDQLAIRFRNLLEVFGYSQDDMKIYLRADYSPLHEK